MDDVPIVYINLARSTERRTRMEAMFAEHCISNYVRVDAFDGKKLYSDASKLAACVSLPSVMKQSPGEIGCALSHLLAAKMCSEAGHEYALVMEDDIHLTFYASWRTSLKEIVASAPADWQVLQLTINNVRVMRTLLGLGCKFAPWRKNHWSTGAYLINKKGCERCMSEYLDSSGKWTLPPKVQLVSDVLMFNGPGAYTHTRPLFDHEIAESTIHQAHVETCHRQASDLGGLFYGRLDLAWAGGDDSRAAIACSLNELGRPDQSARLEWWVRYHLRLGVRWLVLLVEGEEEAERERRRSRIASDFKWLGDALHVLCGSDLRELDEISLARRCGASWLLKLRDDELLYVLPGRSLRAVFDEARRSRSAGDSGAFALRLDDLETQRRASSEAAVNDSTYNFFASETLFKRRSKHSDGSRVSAEDDRAFYDQPPAAAFLKGLPARDRKGSNASVDCDPLATNFLGAGLGRCAVRLCEPGLEPLGPHAWRCARGDASSAGLEVVSSRAFVLTFAHCHFDAWRRAFSDDGKKAEDSATLFERESRAVLASVPQAEESPAAFYARRVLLPAGPEDCEEFDAAQLAQQAGVVHVTLPNGCVRSDCGGAYVRLVNRGSREDGSSLYQQQGGAHHLYRVSQPFVAWMVGRTPYSSTAALVAHDLAVRPQDVRAAWSAFDGRRWAVVPAAHVRLEQHVVSGERYAVLCCNAQLETELDTLRALMQPPCKYQPSSFYPCELVNDCWWAATANGEALGRFLTAELAEAAVVQCAKRLRRVTYLREVKDSGAVLVYLPASCGAAADACAGVYVPHLAKDAKKPAASADARVYRHEEGAHYLYFYAPFAAWMIGSRPGSGSAALIAYDGAARPELIAHDAPWRVYDGRAWREVSDVKVKALADDQDRTTTVRPTPDDTRTPPPTTTTTTSEEEDDTLEKATQSCDCALSELPHYAWTPPPASEDPARSSSVGGGPLKRRFLVYTCAGDRSVLKMWLQNGARDFDLWVTYFGKQTEDCWKAEADLYRRRAGGKFENLQVLYKEPELCARFHEYDAVLVMDDDVVIDAARINRLFATREHANLHVLQPAFERRGKVSHALTAVQPANKLRLTNFVEMTCPLFSTESLCAFLSVFDADLKGWGADWWFLTVVARVHLAQSLLHRRLSVQEAIDASPSRSNRDVVPASDLRGCCAVLDTVSCINPTDGDKAGVREINVLQGREDRRAVWQRIRDREHVTEWAHLQFDTLYLDDRGRPLPKNPAKDATPLRIKGTRTYEMAPKLKSDSKTHPTHKPPPATRDPNATPEVDE